MRLIDERGETKQLALSLQLNPIFQFVMEEMMESQFNHLGIHTGVLFADLAVP